MEISDLKIFLAVARCGSISAAAKSLNYVQSNVTARIQQLEDRLQARLFHRKSRGVALTSSGTLLFDYAVRLTRLAAEAEAVVSQQDSPRGQLTIGSMETTAAIRLPKLLAAYHRACPQVSLNLVTGTSEESLNRLLEFQVDVALVGGEVSHPQLMAEKAFEEELVLVTPTPAARSVDGCEEKILVFRAGCSYRARLESWLRSEGRVPFNIMEFGSIEAILACVGAGMGVSLLPRSLVESARFRGDYAIQTLPEDVGRITTWLVRRHNDRETPTLKTFRKLLLEE
ncbi:MAG: LysR family transcriptional regulator [Desulfuromonadales bacterium]|nr:LysR family transcriptional regulator [Desulfuromonadales bacterium]MDW7758106.1 LysR family transcriptional regulator [Desulfuromonadales bacterium]